MAKHTAKPERKIWRLEMQEQVAMTGNEAGLIGKVLKPLMDAGLLSQTAYAAATGKHAAPAALPRLLTRKETAGMLKVTPRCLVNWEHEGILKALPMAGKRRVRYLLDDVQAVMIGGKGA